MSEFLIVLLVYWAVIVTATFTVRLATKTKKDKYKI